MGIFSSCTCMVSAITGYTFYQRKDGTFFNWHGTNGTIATTILVSVSQKKSFKAQY